MKWIDKIADAPKDWIERVEKLVGIAEILGYFTQGFVVMILWGILAVHFGIPTLGYWYAVTLVYLVRVLQHRPSASERYKRTINVEMEYQDNLHKLEEMAEDIKRWERLLDRKNR